MQPKLCLTQKIFYITFTADKEDLTMTNQPDAAAAQETLDKGTWPEVIGMFIYFNSKASRVTESEFARLHQLFSENNLPALAKFVEIVQFEETSANTTMSYNFSLRPRYPDNVAMSEEERVAAAFNMPDMPVGTRGGTDGAMVWLSNFANVLTDMEPAAVQIFDKIFAEANEMLSDPSSKTTFEEIFTGKKTAPDEQTH
jgi:hypothetical protein